MALSLCNTTTNPQGRELVEHGTPLFPVACYYDDLNKVSVPWHWHEELEAVIICEGTAVVSAGAQTYTLSQGQGFFLNTGLVHGAWSSDSIACRFHSIVFHPRLVGSIDSIFWQNYMQPLLESTTLKSIALDGCDAWHQQALQSIEAAWQSCAGEPFGYEFEVRTALSQLVLCLTAYQPAVTKQPSEKALRDNERIKIMLRFIQEHYFEPLTVGVIAQQAMISESECLRCFRATIGTPPIQYLKHFRVQKAAELLLSTDGKVVDIGVQCGFEDTSYFIKSFRALKHCTPAEYRKDKSV